MRLAAHILAGEAVAGKADANAGNEPLLNDGEFADSREAADLGKAVLLYNENAGGTTIDPDEIAAGLRDSGFDTDVRVTASVDDIGPALAQTEGLVVVAGGDGTIREVVKRLLKTERPLALLPMGTANNIARSLEITGSWQDVVAGLAQPEPMNLDVATAKGPWGTELMLEGAGLGMFANILTSYNPDVGKSPFRALGVAANELGSDSAIHCRIELDGEEIEDEFVLVEAMNMRAIGPRLALAPDADPGDGLLDLVLVRAEGRPALFAYIRALLNGTLAELPSVEVKQGRTVRLHWRGSAFHIDSLALCQDAREASSKAWSAQIEVAPAALEVWRPALD